MQVRAPAARELRAVTRAAAAEGELAPQGPVAPVDVVGEPALAAPVVPVDARVAAVAALAVAEETDRRLPTSGHHQGIDAPRTATAIKGAWQRPN